MTDLDSGQRMTLEVGDYIVDVNGTKVFKHLNAVRLVNNTQRFLTLTVKDVNSGRLFRLKTELINK